MPQLRQLKNGQTRIRFHRPEDRKVREVVKLLRYVAAKRDADCILTMEAGKIADGLEAMADALAKPVKPTKVSQCGSD